MDEQRLDRIEQRLSEMEAHLQALDRRLQRATGMREYEARSVSQYVPPPVPPAAPPVMQAPPPPPPQYQVPDSPRLTPQAEPKPKVDLEDLIGTRILPKAAAALILMALIF